MKYCALAIALLMCVASAQAFTTVCIKADNDETDRGYDEVIDLQSDGVTIKVGEALNDTPENSYYLAMDTGAYNLDRAVSLIAWKDMFAATTGITSVTDIDSATLKMYKRGASDPKRFYVRRITSNWLTKDAGSNESETSGLTMAAGAETSTWAAGAAGFGSGDYTTEDQVYFGCGPYDYNKDFYVDVTEMVKDMFTEGNYGFSLHLFQSPYGDPWFQGDEKTDVGDDGYYVKPTLYLNIIPEPATMGLLAIGGIAALIRKRR